MRNFALFALVLCFVACRDTSGGGQAKPDAQSTDDVSIYDIQSDSMPACDPAQPATCTPFAVRGVVVTAIDTYGADIHDLWVQEPEGGPFSGVKVYRVNPDQLAGLAIGDIVDIEGAVKEEFACQQCAKPDMSGRSLTELKRAPGGELTLTKKKNGEPLQPAQVDALAIGMLDSAERDAEWEKWEGVLITVSNVTQTAKQYAPSNADPDDYEFRITGGVRVRSGLVALPTNAANQCYASITGVGDYFFDWLLLPRTAEDFGGPGAGCPGAETACTDGIDNDGNGFKDCADFSCQDSEPTCAAQPSISQVQMGGVTGKVELVDVYVTAVSFNKRHLWVASSPTAAPYEGIYVYRGSNPADLDATIIPGAKVTVRGSVQENNNDSMGSTLTQIGSNPTVIFVEAPTPSTAPTAVTGQLAQDLLVAATGEPYESVLVTLTNVKVTVQGTSQNFGVGELEQGTTKFAIDDDIYRLPGAAGTCYASVTGIWTYNVYNNVYAFLPTSKVDGGTCD
jgi:hypothetical protein